MNCMGAKYFISRFQIDSDFGFLGFDRMWKWTVQYFLTLFYHTEMNCMDSFWEFFCGEQIIDVIRVPVTFGQMLNFIAIWIVGPIKKNISHLQRNIYAHFLGTKSKEKYYFENFENVLHTKQMIKAFSFN